MNLYTLKNTKYVDSIKIKNMPLANNNYLKTSMKKT